MKSARKRLGLSQEDTARRLDVALRTYARWERGESLGFVGHLATIAKALETDESELMGGEALLGGSAVRELSSKLDAMMEELKQLRLDLEPPQ